MQEDWQQIERKLGWYGDSVSLSLEKRFLVLCGKASWVFLASWDQQQW